MAIDPTTYYRTIPDYDAYFADRLHETDWSGSSTTLKEQAALIATRDFDALQFAGEKKTVFDLLAIDPNSTEAEIAAASALQLLEFPRDDQAVGTIPDNAFFGVCEIAHARLGGRDPDLDFENLVLTSSGAGSTRVSSDRSQMPPEHTSNMIVSAIGWRYLRPFLADNNTFDITRIT